MRSFFKSFFASLFALVVFSLLVLLVMVLFVGGLTRKVKPRVADRSVLVVDLRHHYREQPQENPFSLIMDQDEGSIPGLYEAIRLIYKAKNDAKIAGVYVLTRGNPNGFAASNELRNALVDFRSSGKFIYAHGDIITQRDYAVANVADSIFVNPQGLVEWVGLNTELAFFKGSLEKLQIEPQIFYAGKFKSATEPFRSDKMTEENKLQTAAWLNDLYDEFLTNTSAKRKLDTATLRQLANEGKVFNPSDALEHKLIDGIKYDDEVRQIIHAKLGLKKEDKINFITLSTYKEAARKLSISGGNIALIYAEGAIIGGKGREGLVADEEYRTLIRKARLNKDIKAIVFRINSGGGSALASENIWRELSIAKKEKPVVVSFGDVAASGGYYIACSADSIFADRSTITGSIGVFGIIPNMESFFKNKLGITFDGVKTGPLADAGAPYRPMTEKEKEIIQGEIDKIYATFKSRVAEGRRKDTSYVEEIAQGRVWTGLRAKELGLIDRFGGIQDAIDCAARMGKVKNVRIVEMPEREDLFDKLFRKANPFDIRTEMKKELGEENYRLFEEMKMIREMCNETQARLPFQFYIR